MIKRHLSISLLILAILPFGTSKAYARWIDTQTIVATIDGEPIFYGEIKFEENVADTLFEKKFSRPPKNENDFKTVKQIQRKKENENLARAIRHHIYDEVLEKKKIIPTTDELIATHEKMFKDQDSDSKREQIRENIPFILAAEAVQNNKMTVEEAYKKYIQRKKNSYRISTFKRFLNNYRSPEQLDTFKKYLYLTGDEITQAIQTRRNRPVIENKLNHIIDEELIATDPEFADLYIIQKEIRQFKEKRKKLESWEPFGESLARQKRLDWWGKQYREADIQIKAPEFSSALKLVLESKYKGEFYRPGY